MAASSSTAARTPLVGSIPKISLDLIQSELAILPGGQDKSGNYVVIFPPKKHAAIGTQYAFGDHILNLLRYFVAITTYTGVYRKRFTFFVDLRSMNHQATAAIFKSLTTLHKEHPALIDSVIVLRPKDKKQLKALQKILGIGSKTKDDEAPPPPPLPYTVHLLMEQKELHKRIDLSQLPLEGGGYMPYKHTDFFEFIKILEEKRQKGLAKSAQIEGVIETLRGKERGRNGQVSWCPEQVDKEVVDSSLVLRDLEKYKEELLNPANNQRFSSIPSALLIELASTVIRDLKDDLTAKKEKLASLRAASRSSSVERSDLPSPRGINSAHSSSSNLAALWTGNFSPDDVSSEPELPLPETHTPLMASRIQRMPPKPSFRKAANSPTRPVHRRHKAALSPLVINDGYQRKSESDLVHIATEENKFYARSANNSESSDIRSPISPQYSSGTTSDEFDSDDPPQPSPITSSGSSRGYESDPRRRRGLSASPRNSPRVHRKLSPIKSVAFKTEQDIGVEILSWFRTTGLELLDRNQSVPDSASDAERKLSRFESRVVPKCLDKMEEAEDWLANSDDTLPIWNEIQSEILSFRKSLQRVRNQYESVNNFFKHVKKAIEWYQMIVREMPRKLLDVNKRPDPEALQHYASLTDQEHDVMKSIKQRYPHLSPAIANGINKHLIFIPDFTLRMEARLLVQRCVLIDKLIDTYSQDAGETIKAIYQNRRGPNSVPTPSHSTTSSFAFDDDQGGLDEHPELFRGFSESLEGSRLMTGSGRMPDKKQRHNRSLPAFSPPSSLSNFTPQPSPAPSISPTESSRSFQSTSSTASSSTPSLIGANGQPTSRAHRPRPKLSGLASGGRSSNPGSITNLRMRMDAIDEHP